MRNTGKIKYLLTVLLAGISLTGCGSIGLAHESTFESAFANTDEKQSDFGKYDSADTAIVKMVNTEEQKITLVNVELNKEYTLSYDGATQVRDKYDGAMSMPQIQAGDVVDVCFMKETKRLTSLQMSPDTFIYESISRYNIDGERKNAVIGDENFRLSDSTLIISEGRQIEAADIVSRDVVTIKGIGRDVYSIIVEKGHGFLRLEGDTYVIGGWIEAGQSAIQQITEDMLLTVPEGDMDVHVTARGIDTVRSITIKRDKESVIDLSDIVIENPEIGKVYFTVTPSTADVYVDGELADIGRAVEMAYGLHQIVCEASGYDSITQYIQVNQEIASVTISLDEYDSSQSASSGTQGLPGVSDNSISGNSSSSSSVSGNSLTAGSYRLYIDSPEDVEVYQDGVYMGISPVNFLKTVGSHTITLRKQGYITKSYTIHINDDNKDVSYTFPQLQTADDSEDDDNDDDEHASGSNVSGNNSGNNDESDASGNNLSGNSIN